ncbi:MAG: tRNA lysidine(34) synthetase TilS [Homoserinimonas sp.]
MTSRRPRLTPAVADVRRAVRDSLAVLCQAGADVPERTGTIAPHGNNHEPLPERTLVLAGLSGGPDSLALAAATAFEAPRAGLRVGAIIVDHGLQEGSADVAARAAGQARRLGLDPVVVTRVQVGSAGGPEAAAREARYLAYAAATEQTGAAAVLLGHTLDDQAETVLLGLARGSGAGSLQGMAPVSCAEIRHSGAQDNPEPSSGATQQPLMLLRPLLGIRRATTVAFCADSGLEPWDDPHNTDPAYARVRVRSRVLPILERELGPGVADALARTAEQLREDESALDHFAEELIEDLAEHAEAGISLAVRGLEANPPALRQRIIRLAVSAEFGIALSRSQTLEVARLVTDWHGQGAVHLPGVRVERHGHLLVFSSAMKDREPH